jgi:hypothetical protein
LKILPYGRLPAGSTGGSNSTYETDAIFYNSSVALGYGCVGGYFNQNLNVAPFCVDFTYDLSSKSKKYYELNTALSCKPSAPTP